MSFYTASQQQLQSAFDSRQLAERVEQAIVTDAFVPELHQPFIESRDFQDPGLPELRREPPQSLPLAQSPNRPIAQSPNRPIA